MELSVCTCFSICLAAFGSLRIRFTCWLIDAGCPIARRSAIQALLTAVRRFPADFTTVTRPSEDVLLASDGTLLNGQFSGTDFIFHLDVPDGITQFTLRQQPILIPEPSCLTLPDAAWPGFPGFPGRAATPTIATAPSGPFKLGGG